MKPISTILKAHLITSVFAVVVFASTACANETKEALKALQAAVEKEVAQRKPDEKNNPYRAYGDMSGLVIGQLQSAISRNERNLDHQLGQVSVYFKTKEVREATNRLREALEADRTAQEAEYAKKLETALTSATKAIQDAKKPADLDAALNDLEKLKEQAELFQSYETRNANVEKTQRARQFIGYWQNHLANDANNNRELAIENLQAAAKENTLNLIPRSEILARIQSLRKAEGESAIANPEQTVREVVLGAKSLDEIPKALDALAELRRSSAKSERGWDSAITSAQRELSPLLQGYREYQAGLPIQLELRSSQYGDRAYNAYADALPLRVALIRLVAPRVLKVSNLTPGADEPIGDYLDRVMDQAKKNADAKLIGRVQDLRDKLAGKSASASTLNTLRTTIAGQSQEEAGQWMLAVISYQQAIQSGNDLVPVEAIAKRLEAIKTEHPDEYKKAMELIPRRPQGPPPGFP